MYTQENRLIAIETPLGQDVLLLKEFSGTESVSKLFSYRLTLLSENHRISFADIIGQKVTLSINLNRGEKRFINGIVASFSQSSSGTTRIETGTFSQYTATIIPWPWLLTRTSDIRIFQELSVPDIIEKIFREKGFSDFSLRLHGQYEKKVYCVQYRETDFNFVSRLMEEVGIYYFFEHESGKHTLVLADSTAEHPPCPEQETARYHQTEGAFLDEDVINALEVRQEIRVGKFTLNDYNFETPSTKLTVEAVSRVELGPGEREIYDYPAEYEKRAQGDRIVNIFMESEEAQITSIFGSSNCRAFRTGYRFDLQDYFREDMNDKPYVLMEISHTASSNAAGTGSEVATTYSNSFSCIPHETPFRPPRMTAKPIVEGIQTAIVVGPPGEEIYTDKYGRIKVQFHWDREGKKDENSSCWIRVSQAWAGASWGGIYIPRIGQEVIVEFLEGDPDRPIITGRVYNASQTPPYALPENATQSGVKSRSSKGGVGENFNEIRFEDKKGVEQIVVHAEKNMDTTVEADDALEVGGDRKVHVKGHFTENIDSGETRTVDAGSTETINAGMTLTINGGETRTVNGGARETINGGEIRTVNGGTTESINGGETRTVTGGITETITGAFTQNVSGGIMINSPAGVTITAPAGFKVIAPGGTTTVDSFFDSHGGKNFDAFGMKMSISGASIEIVGGVAMGYAANKLELVGMHLCHTTAKLENTPAEIKSVGQAIAQSIINIHAAGMFIVA